MDMEDDVAQKKKDKIQTLEQENDKYRNEIVKMGDSNNQKEYLSVCL